jgi:trigger factor
MKQGEEKLLDIEFPKDYHNSQFAGKKTKFQVHILKVEHAHPPEFTKEFIKELRGKELELPEFKELIR